MIDHICKAKILKHLRWNLRFCPYKENNVTSKAAVSVKKSHRSLLILMVETTFRSLTDNLVTKLSII